MHIAKSWNPAPQSKVNASSVVLHSSSALVITAPDARVESLDLDGALVVEGAAGQEVVVEGGVVNGGWVVEALKPDEGASEEAYIR